MERNPHPEIAEEEFRFAETTSEPLSGHHHLIIGPMMPDPVADPVAGSQMQEPSKETV